MDDLKVSQQTLKMFHKELEIQRKFIKYIIWKNKLKKFNIDFENI